LIPSLENPDLIYYWFNPDPDEKKSNDEISKINNEYPYSIIKKLYFENDSINRTRDKLFSFSEDIKSPSVQFTHYIAKKAIQNNITVGYNTLEYGFDDLTEGAPLDTSQYIFKPLATWYSPSLSEITAKTNAQSINLYAECILRAIGIQKYGPSTLDTSIVAVKTFWKDEVGSLQGLRMTDGSGLSRSNLCTPLLFCKMLTAYTKRDNFNSFYSTIPIAGREGTVKNFAVGTAAENNARLKSGSMSRVKCYAGYVKGKNGKLYAVSIMFNNFEPDATVTAAAAKLIGKVAELKGGKPKKEFVVNRGNK
jgi:D-alanyl-D-alanine carboxypeptidase/D-alanyl-D-alanine-endopeptidase (penicillin-binding protein 4)